MLFIRPQVFLIILTLMSFTSGVSARQVPVGWAEEVIIGSSEFLIEAKIDTGADNSSINAVNPELYKKHGREWVKFSIQNDHGRELIVDTPVTKRTQVKTKSGGIQPRVVIELDICLASIKKSVPVNLIDRSHFKYQVLIGRSFLSPEFLVDSGKKYTTGPKCR